MFPSLEQVARPKSRERAKVVEEEHIHQRGIPSRYERLVEFVRRGIGDGHHPRQPWTPPAQSVLVGQGQQSVAECMSKFFDREIEDAKLRHLL